MAPHVAERLGRVTAVHRETVIKTLVLLGSSGAGKSTIVNTLLGTHAQEPGCAVRAHVEPDRLKNYRELLREVRRDVQTALDRQRQVADWKARGRLARARLRAKRGEA